MHSVCAEGGITPGEKHQGEHSPDTGARTARPPRRGRILGLCADDTASRNRGAAFPSARRFRGLLPRVQERRVIRARLVEVVLPLFPNYLFARIQLQWSRARWSIGVSRIVLDGERPAVIPDDVIDAIRRRDAMVLSICRSGRNAGEVI